MALLVKRVNKDSSFYRRLKYIIFVLLLIPAILAFYLTTEDRLKVYEDEGNQKAINYRQERARVYAKEAFDKVFGEALRDAERRQLQEAEEERRQQAIEQEKRRVQEAEQRQQQQTEQRRRAEIAMPKFTGIVTGDQVNIRTGPSTQTTSLLKVNKNFKVEVVEEGREWHKIKYTDANGRIGDGYISAQYVQREGVAARPSNSPASKPTTPNSSTSSGGRAITVPEIRPAANARYDQLMAEAGRYEQRGDLEPALANYREALHIKDSLELRTIVGNLDVALRRQNEQTSLAYDFEKEGDRLAALGNYRGAQREYRISLTTAANPRVETKLMNVATLEKAYFLLNEGDAFMKAKNYTAAIAKYQESLSLVNSPVARNRLSSAQAAREEAQKADEIGKAVLKGVLQQILRKK